MATQQKQGVTLTLNVMTVLSGTEKILLPHNNFSNLLPTSS